MKGVARSPPQVSLYTYHEVARLIEATAAEAFEWLGGNKHEAQKLFGSAWARGYLDSVGKPIKIARVHKTCGRDHPHYCSETDLC